MSKVSDMAIARQACKKLAGISVANSHLVAFPGPKLMALSIATAAVAKSKAQSGACILFVDRAAGKRHVRAGNPLLGGLRTRPGR